MRKRRLLKAHEIHPDQLHQRKPKAEKEWPTQEMIAAECALIRAEHLAAMKDVDPEPVWFVPVVRCEVPR